MINLITNGDQSLKRKIEHLLGHHIPLTTTEINKMAHLTPGNLWIPKVLDKLGLTIDDIVFEQARDQLRMEIAQDKANG